VKTGKERAEEESELSTFVGEIFRWVGTFAVFGFKTSQRKTDFLTERVSIYPFRAIYIAA
jgi:hypothetical protein